MKDNPKRHYQWKEQYQEKKHYQWKLSYVRKDAMNEHDAEKEHYTKTERKGCAAEEPSVAKKD